MKHQDAIVRALQAADLPTTIKSARDLSGGCIHQVVQITIQNGVNFIAKVNRADRLQWFEEEAAGLRALAATKTVLVPEPLAVIAHAGEAVLLMSAIDTAGARATDAAWRQFGRDLAALHSADAGSRYGFSEDNHIGSTLQVNHWCDDWIEFNARNRLGYQVQLAVDNALLTPQEVEAIQAVLDQLKDLLPQRPKPALLHGDLWSGNALPAAGDRIAVIDPACSIGDGWADIAMMKLFGGFPQSCFDAYASINQDHERLEQRIVVYQLYHVLNHVNIFGRGYAAQALELARTLT